MSLDPQRQPAGSGLDQAADEFDVSSAPGNERQAAERVVALVRQTDLLPGRLEQLETAVAEAVLNAMEHGNQYRADLPVTVRVTVSEEALAVCITDRGTGVPMDCVEEPDLAAKLAGKQSPRGWGLFLIRQLTDDVRVVDCEDEHVVELRWYLDKAGENKVG